MKVFEDGYTKEGYQWMEIKGSRIYAALKGILDAGLNIPHSDGIFPNEERIKGKHISEDIEKNMEDTKKKIIR